MRRSCRLPLGVDIGFATSAWNAVIWAAATLANPREEIACSWRVLRDAPIALPHVPASHPRALKHAPCSTLANAAADVETRPATDAMIPCPVCRQRLRADDHPAIRNWLIRPRPAAAAAMTYAAPPAREGGHWELCITTCFCCCNAVSQLYTSTGASSSRHRTCFVIAATLWILFLVSQAVDFAADLIDARALNTSYVDRTVLDQVADALQGDISHLFTIAPYRLSFTLRMSGLVAFLFLWGGLVLMLHRARRGLQHALPQNSVALTTPACCVPCLASALLYHLGYTSTNYRACVPLRRVAPPPGGAQAV